MKKKPRGRPSTGGPDPIRPVRMPDKLHKDTTRAAKRAGLSWSEWMREAARRMLDTSK